MNIIRSERGQGQPTLGVLGTLKALVPQLDGYAHLVLPVLLRLLEQIDIPFHSLRKPGNLEEARLRALDVIATFVEEIEILEFASMIIHPVTRIASGMTVISSHGAIPEDLQLKVGAVVVGVGRARVEVDMKKSMMPNLRMNSFFFFFVKRRWTFSGLWRFSLGPITRRLCQL